ncbi:hypothetical protein BC940DRAFT_306204 [Gongronella butleri]|nr:hypothetical protein BC940DRAFT_306204 [Gongronella butleri]
MKLFTEEIGPAQPNGGRIRRSTLSPDAIVRVPGTTVHTLYDVLQHSVKKYGDKKAFGRRRVERIVEEEKEVTKYVNGVETKQMKTWKYFQMSPYEYVSYNEASAICHAIGNAFVALGLESKAKVEIFSSTTMDWLLMAHGLFTQNMTIVTAYETLGEEGLLHSMTETEVEAIFTTVDLLPVVARVAAKCPSLKFVVYSGEPNPEVANSIKAHVQDVLTLDALIQLGNDFQREPRKPEPEDLCCIMYTSGSTGNPKGVMLSHKNIVAAIGGVTVLMGRNVSSSDSMMAYLPLAHVLEFTVENSCVFWGVTLGYASIRTLTDASVRNCKGDIKEFRPTLMTGVPAVWESIRKGILTKINSSSPGAQKIFYKAYATKSWLFERNMPSKILDAVVFSKIREQVGGRLRLALSGGAPLSVETQKFLSVCLCPILGGFGMTESCGMSTVMAPEQFGYNHVGSPVPCCEIKLVDVPDANYFSTNTPKPQGEVWVRGPSVTKGYWKRDDITRETITDDGWLMTGDIAEWNENGTLSIIDRKKNLVKLSNGEYIALEKLESIYKSCLFVGNICVYADSLVGKPVALAVPLEPAVRKWADENGVEEKDWERLCQTPKVRKAVLAALTEQGKLANLKPAEFLFDVYLCHEEWTTESGLMTAAQKIKRQDINKKFKEDLDAMNAAQRA